MQYVFRAALLGTVAFWVWPVEADTRLISEPAAAEHGLTRAWFTQIGMDRSRSRVEYLGLHDGTLYVQTDRAMLHALDGETGQLLWSQQVGNPDHPSSCASAGGDLVALINGGNLFVLNRYNGDLLWTTRLGAVAGAGPAVSGDRVYVPMLSGLVQAYRMTPVQGPPEDDIEKIAQIPKEEPSAEQKKAQEIHRRESLRLDQKNVEELSCQSFGRIRVSPTITRCDKASERAAWTTDRGSIFVGQIDLLKSPRFLLVYQVAVESEVAGQLAHIRPESEATEKGGLIVFATQDGTVRAIGEETGDPRWHFSAGETIHESVAVIDGQLYVATQIGGMYCLGAADGRERWLAPGVKHFVAASKGRVYAADALGRIHALDAQTGQRLDTLPTASIPIALGNVQTDRIYLATEGGLIQCLHEIELREPLEHLAPAAVAEEPKPAAKPATPPAKPRAAAPSAAPTKGPATDHKAVEKKPEVNERPQQKQPRAGRERATRAKAKAGDGAGENP